MSIPTFSVRQSDVGGPIAESVVTSPARFRPSSSRLIVLIHGYNNTRQAAEKGYAAFVKLLDSLGVPANSSYGEIAGFYWPGDKRLGVAAFVSYPTEMGPAKT